MSSGWAKRSSGCWATARITTSARGGGASGSGGRGRVAIATATAIGSTASRKGCTPPSSSCSTRPRENWSLAAVAGAPRTVSGVA
jgi:hypothetical protein